MSYPNYSYYNYQATALTITFVTIGVIYGIFLLGFLAVCLCGRKKIYPGHIIRKEGVTGPSMIMGASYGNAGASMATSFVNPMQTPAFQHAGQQQQLYPQAVSGYPSPHEAAPPYQEKMAQ